jgi:trans-aconitate methyltransferase
LRQLKKQTPRPARIIEIGAGEGDLCCKISITLPSSTVTGLDLIQRAGNLPKNIKWNSGDFFQTLPKIDADACVGSLILHHFSDEALRDLGARLQSFRSLTFCEPLRSRLPLFLSKLSYPFLSEVTRHDMPASIRAGFRPDELPALLGLNSKNWHIRESSHWRGALRLVASRR